MEILILVAICAFLAGFFGTAVLVESFGRAMAGRFPAAQIGAGLFIGWVSQTQQTPIIIGAIFGMVGWFIYSVTNPAA